MATPVNMPQIGQDIETGLIVEWFVQENQRVEKGQVIVSVESEKASFDVEAPESGVLLKQLFAKGEEAKVFGPIAYIGNEGEKPDQSGAEPKAAQPGRVTDSADDNKKKQAEPSVSQASSETGGGKSAVSPSARRLAKEKGVDINTIRGNGPGGRIIKKDVAAAQKTGRVTLSIPVVSKIADQDQVIPFTKIRKRIGDRLLMSKQTIPHFYLFTDVDMTGAVRWRKAYNESNNQHITLNDVVVKAAAAALREFPMMNVHVEAEKLIARKSINIGIAVSIEGGLLVPVVGDADKKSIAEISRVSRENAADARKGKVDVKNQGTFTISNLGQYQITQFIPVINPPEAAILGVGRIQDRAVPILEGFAVIKNLCLSLACDHRAVDGVYGSQFLSKIKEHLESFKV
ncbi:MAG: dihydrolipoamide acetyltransferase family protein [bacterium]